MDKAIAEGLINHHNTFYHSITKYEILWDGVQGLKGSYDGAELQYLVCLSWESIEKNTIPRLRTFFLDKFPQAYNRVTGDKNLNVVLAIPKSEKFGSEVLDRLQEISYKISESNGTEYPDIWVRDNATTPATFTNLERPTVGKGQGANFFN